MSNIEFRMFNVEVKKVYLFQHSIFNIQYSLFQKGIHLLFIRRERR